MQEQDVPAVAELRVSKDRRQLTVRYADDEEFVLFAELLRVYSPSAEVRGHSSDQRKLIYGKRNVEIMRLAPVGNYAIRITFDDLHDTGIYSWLFLRDMGDNQSEYLRKYEQELAENNRSRDP